MYFVAFDTHLVLNDGPWLIKRLNLLPSATKRLNFLHYAFVFTNHDSGFDFYSNECCGPRAAMVRQF